MTVITLQSPFTRETVFEQTAESYSQIETKLSRARSAFNRWNKVSPGQRAEMILKALDKFRDAEGRISKTIAAETGKPATAAAQELAFMIERAEHMCRQTCDGALNDLDLSQYHTEDFSGSIRYSGKGIIYIISPWNYPLFTAINGIICALLSGSTVILKHTTTPSVGALMEEVFQSLGEYQDLLFNITTDYETSARIIEQGDIDHVVFTGSVQGGRVITQSIARRALNTEVRSPFIETSLELGSNDACYIAEDADLEAAALWAIKIGRLHNSGQSCCAVKRLYVHRSVYPQMLEAARAIMQAEVSGDPMDDNTTLGPLFGGSTAIDNLLELVDDARQQGGTVITGGQAESIAGCEFIQPTLVADCHHGMRIMHEETFGPVLPVMPVSSDEEALQLIADTRFGLTASIFTRSRKRAGQFLELENFGTLFINRCNFVDARLSWTGRGHSGNGSLALSPEGLRAFSSKTSLNINAANLSD